MGRLQYAYNLLLLSVELFKLEYDQLGRAGFRCSVRERSEQFLHHSAKAESNAQLRRKQKAHERAYLAVEKISRAVLIDDDEKRIKEKTAVRVNQAARNFLN